MGFAPRFWKQVPYTFLQTVTNDKEGDGCLDDVRALGEDNEFELTLCDLLTQAFSQ